MEAWELEVENRIPVGIAFGWSYFGIDDEYDHGELKIYLGLISLNFKWQ
tara:strand:+ start:1105 stop:1251 length:147 start_codon:yes stop_codon:yes gene_type:complete